MPRPCECGQCRLCFLAANEPAYQRLWGLPVTAGRRTPPTARVRHCPMRKRWDWSIVANDRTLASGSAKTETEAREDAALALADLSPGRSILLTGGIGDVFAVEGMMTAEERETLEAIYYACPASEVIRQAWSALPNFPRLTSHVVLPTGRQVFRNESEVVIHGHTVPAGTEDWNIGAVFSQRRPYAGSSFLAHKLAALPERFRVPGPYVIVQPISSWGRWRNRAFDAGDWNRVRAFLEARNLYGVILNQHGSALPNWPCLIGWQGITSMAESIELLKASQGYLGIDSCLSVLAAKLFPPQRLAVKGTRPHIYQNAWAYYQPHAAFPFLQRTLQSPPWDL